MLLIFLVVCVECLFSLFLLCVMCPMLSVSPEFARSFKYQGSFCSFCPIKCQRSQLGFVMSVTISAQQRFPVRLLSLFFVGGLMSLLCYFFLLAYIGVQHCFLLCVYTFFSSALKRRSVRLYLQLCVIGLMSYLCYLCLLAHTGVKYELLTPR